MKPIKECRYGHICTSDCQNTRDCPCLTDHCCAMSEEVCDRTCDDCFFKEKEIYVYGSSEGIKHPKVGDLKLNVISQWDFSTDSVCFQTQDKTIGGGKITISYALERCTEVVSPTHTKWELVDKVESEVAEHLEKRGYTVSLFKKMFLTPQR